MGRRSRVPMLRRAWWSVDIEVHHHGMEVRRKLPDGTGVFFIDHPSAPILVGQPHCFLPCAPDSLISRSHQRGRKSRSARFTAKRTEKRLNRKPAGPAASHEHCWLMGCIFAGFANSLAFTKLYAGDTGEKTQPA